MPPTPSTLTLPATPPLFSLGTLGGNLWALFIPVDIGHHTTSSLAGILTASRTVSCLRPSATLADSWHLPTVSSCTVSSGKDVGGSSVPKQGRKNSSWKRGPWHTGTWFTVRNWGEAYLTSRKYNGQSTGNARTCLSVWFVSWHQMWALMNV